MEKTSLPDIPSWELGLFFENLQEKSRGHNRNVPMRIINALSRTQRNCAEFDEFRPLKEHLFPSTLPKHYINSRTFSDHEVPINMLAVHGIMCLVHQYPKTSGPSSIRGIGLLSATIAHEVTTPYLVEHGLPVVPAVEDINEMYRQA